MPVPIAVLASGGGTNLQALLDHFHGQPRPAARVALVIGSREAIGALARAEEAGVPWTVLDPRALPAERVEAEMLAALDAHRVELVVLAGYLQLVPPGVVSRYAGRLLNIHPALLPAFGGRGMYGMRVHRAVLESGARVSGASVHLVDDRYDEGHIVAQWPVPVLADDTPERLAARVLRVEHLLLPAAVEALLRPEVSPRGPADPAAFELTGAAAPDADSVRALSGSAPPANHDPQPRA
jgi:formyltetrahydrofolate-dependent phosphoribosylglycinamide formyltransferase